MRLQLDVSTKRTRKFAGVTRIQETHGVVVALETDRRKIEAAIAQRGLGRRALAAQLADWADVNASAALAAELACDVERARHFAVQAASGKTDGARHHLLLAHADTQPALDAGLVLALVPALVHSHG